jgi:hypothetical protein
VFNVKLEYGTVHNSKCSVKVQYAFVWFVFWKLYINGRVNGQSHEKIATTDLQRVTRREERSGGKWWEVFVVRGR